MKRVLVTGAAGQLGAVTVSRFTHAGWQVTAASRAELDITSHEAVMAMVSAVQPQLIVNCAAFNDVDGAETRAEVALEINAFAVRSLARAAREHQAVFVHYSTDFVFDGHATKPYTEVDPPQPQSVYASSKLLGERFAADADAHYVLRVESLFGGPAARSSIDRIASNLREGREAKVFVDRVVSPSYVDDVAWATQVLLDRRAPFGLYHCVNSGWATWYDVGREVARLVGADEGLLSPVRVADVQLKAKRPTFAALDNDKLRRAGVAMASWQDALVRYSRAATTFRPRA